MYSPVVSLRKVTAACVDLMVQQWQLSLQPLDPRDGTPTYSGWSRVVALPTALCSAIDCRIHKHDVNLKVCSNCMMKTVLWHMCAMVWWLGLQPCFWVSSVGQEQQISELKWAYPSVSTGIAKSRLVHIMKRYGLCKQFAILSSTYCGDLAVTSGMMTPSGTVASALPTNCREKEDTLSASARFNMN